MGQAPALQVLRERRSVRKYTDQEVDRETLQTIVDCGRLAPTARNEQPWEFVVVTDEDRLRTIAGLTDHGRFIADAAACIVVFCRDSKYYLEDGSAATTTMLLAAAALGVGACWVAGDKKSYAGRIGELLGVPDDMRLISLISLGYAAEMPTKQKRNLQDVLHWNSF